MTRNQKQKLDGDFGDGFNERFGLCELFGALAIGAMWGLVFGAVIGGALVYRMLHNV